MNHITFFKQLSSNLPDCPVATQLPKLSREDRNTLRLFYYVFSEGVPVIPEDDQYRLYGELLQKGFFSEDFDSESKLPFARITPDGFNYLEYLHRKLKASA